jgi:DNA-binding MurR/RpiR family transcriptional regulator
MLADDVANTLDPTEGAAPRSYEALKATILERRDKLPRRLSQVAVHMLDHPEEVAFGTAASIASSARVQPSTLVRFAQYLGYAGFSDLQLVFRDRLRTPTGSYDERLAAIRAGDIKDNENKIILKGFFAAASQSIEKLSSSINMTRFERAATILAAADTVYIIARRRAFPVAAYLAYALGKLGIRHILTGSPAGLDADALQLARPKDAAIVISFAPYAPETVEMARLLARRSVPIVSITDSIFSPLANCADEWLEIDEVDFSGFRSLSATMALGMALSVAIAGARRPEKSTSTIPDPSDSLT